MIANSISISIVINVLVLLQLCYPIQAAYCGCNLVACGPGKTCGRFGSCELPKPDDGTPACLQSESGCCGSPMVGCAANEICEYGKCIDRSTCPRACERNMCPEKDEYCVDVLNSTTTFFRCVKTTRCGCLAGINAKCDCRSTCLNNKCQPVPDTDPSVMPACLTDGGGFCGVANNESSLVMCASDQVCESNKCVSPSKCPVRGQCYGCEHAGIRSYYDGCNTCSCPTDNQQTMCTEQVCEPVTIVPKECDGQCNGFLTEDDGVCGRCTCNQGQKTECTKGETNECKAHLASASSTSVSVGLVVAISIATIIWN